MKKKAITVTTVILVLIICFLLTLNNKLPGTLNLKGDFKGDSTVLKWDSIEEADYYNIYRKQGKRGSSELIGRTDSLYYTDVYKDSVTKKEERKLLNIGMFIDPSENPFVYKVEAVKGKGIFRKKSEGAEDFHVEAPSVVSVKEKGRKAEITWSELPNAEKYYVYTGRKDNGVMVWEKSGEFLHTSDVTQKAVIDKKEDNTYYTVKAVFIKNGKKVISDYDKEFNIANRQYKGTKVLFIGDSITFGSPYKEKDVRNIFSYPARIRQLTDVEIYVPSIPGASYAYKDEKDRDRIVTQVAAEIHNGRIPEATDERIIFDGKPGRFEDFDVIVMAAGANDYFDNIPLGKTDSKEIYEFSGAVNQIMKWIGEGNNKRVEQGKEPAKIIFSKLFYNNKNGYYSGLTFRVPEKNGLGLKMSDYQECLDELIEQYEKQGFEIYEFETENFVTEENFPYVTSDGLHMSRFTYGRIGNEMSLFMIKNKILRKY